LKTVPSLLVFGSTEVLTTNVKKLKVIPIAAIILYWILNPIIT
jgi:hypothetical protein